MEFLNEYKYDKVDDNIIFDLHDSLGTKLAGLRQVSSMLEELNKEEEVDRVQLKKFTGHLNDYLLSLAFELRIFKWANNPANNTVFETVNKIKSLKREIVGIRKKDIIFRVNHNLEKDYYLPRYFNRQLVLLFNDLFIQNCILSDCSSFQVNVTKKSDENVVIAISYNGNLKNITESERDKYLLMMKRVKSLNGSCRIQNTTNDLIEIFVEL